MPVAVVTGANRGLGRETARQLVERGWQVVVCGRTLAKAWSVANELGAVAAGVDVTSTQDCAALAKRVAKECGRLDALVNNAGAILEPDGPAIDADPHALLRTVDNNAIGAFRVTQALLPLLRADGGGNVVMVSSGMGALTDMGGGWPGYRLSKAAMNVLTKVLHAEHHADGVRFNSVCPGWVRTDMGGPRATRSVEEGAAGIVWAATLDADGPSGGFFRDGEPISF